VHAELHRNDVDGVLEESLFRDDGRDGFLRERRATKEEERGRGFSLESSRDRRASSEMEEWEKGGKTNSEAVELVEFETEGGIPEGSSSFGSLTDGDFGDV